MKEPSKALLIILFFCIPLFVCACGKEPPKRVVRPPDVTAALPVQREVPKYLEYTGTTAALQTVDIRARVAGFLQKMYFEPRSKVKAGDLLFLIDPRQVPKQASSRRKANWTRKKHLRSLLKQNCKSHNSWKVRRPLAP